METPRPTVATLNFSLESAAQFCAISHTLAQLPEYLTGLQNAFPASNTPIQVQDILREFPAETLREQSEMLASFAALILDDILK